MGGVREEWGKGEGGVGEIARIEMRGKYLRLPGLGRAESIVSALDDLMPMISTHSEGKRPT